MVRLPMIIFESENLPEGWKKTKCHPTLLKGQEREHRELPAGQSHPNASKDDRTPDSGGCFYPYGRLEDDRGSGLNSTKSRLTNHLLW